MTYTTAERIEALLKDFVRVDNYTPEQYAMFIEKAEARINDRLRPYYMVPFSAPVPAMIVSIAEDFACSFMVDQDYIDRPNNEQVPLAQVYFRRAERDLDHIAKNLTLDGLSGVKRVALPREVTSPSAGTTTPNRSPMKAALDQWPV
ncbi:DUF1320 domain-containing protein [Paenibacillus naphthalenovorans]|uniref:DUF1320 domain-containing protein n=1 Tax=Paenibacillus naphthalenovorans TaxID=162209 RepID=UPI00088756D0|nr:DUF1320 domain-containing protein [Paenibacillus naphthalenovorans]SDI49302.1 Protein of unknown function [Paenibacillus naphthalenovorans]